MKAGPDIAMVASLVGDPARSNMLTALMTGRALTASELAHQAGITPQTASSHLAKLEAGGLIEPVADENGDGHGALQIRCRHCERSTSGGMDCFAALAMTAPVLQFGEYPLALPRCFG